MLATANFIVIKETCPYEGSRLNSVSCTLTAEKQLDIAVKFNSSQLNAEALSYNTDKQA